ncbi:MAG TPA: M48 family metallopeptidase [Alphaproteobacteria bacterium]|nr:M48 family metallopeptidase [Alphaproteobacteria bacterium]
MNLKTLPLLLAATALSGCATLSDIDQGLYSGANAVSSADRVTGQRTLGSGDRAAAIASQNAELDKVVEQRTAKGDKFNAAVNAAQYARLQRIAARLLPVTHFAAERSQWRVLLMPDIDWNAYVNGGSIIVVNKGLVDDANMTDDDIAAVLGHEIGHVAANHISERSAYSTAAMLTGSRSSAGRSTFQSSFTLDQETEADRIGLLYAALAGYNPQAAGTLWQRMYQQQGNGGAFISDHPLNRDRATQTAQIAQAIIRAGYYTPGKTNPDAQSLLQNNVLWQHRNQSLQAGSGGGLAAVAETLLTTYTQREQAKNTERSQLAHRQLVQTVGTLLQVGQPRATGADTIELPCLYRGNQPLGTLAIRVVVPGTNLTAVAHSAGTVAPGSSFTVTFTAPGLGNAVSQAKFGVEDAAL